MIIIKELDLSLEAFQGPFDLLLHLIRSLEVDIFDIPIAEVTEQYLKYIEAMEQIELDIVGEYLVMAASLLEIKSRMLLPIEPDIDASNQEEYFDPRDQLVQQLLLYQQFQEVADYLETGKEERALSISRPMADLSPLQEFIPIPEGQITRNDLAHAMQDALVKMQEREPLDKQIRQERLTVQDKIHMIINEFDHKENVFFEDIIQYYTHNEIIVSFLAMLELVKKQYITFIQEPLSESIQMRRVKEPQNELK